MPHLDTFGLKFEKSIVLFEVSTLEFVKNEFLIHWVRVWIRVRFIKNGLFTNFND